jgi:hypothetical protein
LIYRLVCSLVGMSQIHINAAAMNSGPENEMRRIKAQAESIDESDLAGPPNGQGGWVIVEPLNIWPATATSEAQIIPYKYRRESWGQSVSLTYSQFYPDSLESNLGAVNFSDIYDASADTPMLELQFGVKRNFSLGSVGFELAVGYYSNDSDIDLFESSFEIIPVRLGVQYTADAIFQSPYVAPYIAGGGYIFKYTESQGTTSFNGTTQVAPYATLGLQLSLDWLDSRSASIAYFEGGIETTSLFIEGRKYFSSSAEEDPNFETPFQPQAGLRLEF